MSSHSDQIELEEPSEPRKPFSAQTDARRPMPEPPPVRLVAVDDVHLSIAPPAIREKLDAFYVRMLQFESEHDSGQRLTYRAENFRLRFDQKPMEQREDYRAAIIEVRSLMELELQLVEAEIEYERVKGLTPGDESFLIRDPAGNLVSIVERRQVR